jgi:SAM-dependent methyltransferase
LFRDQVRDVLQPHFDLLDLGAGNGRLEQMDFRGDAARIVGIDLDPGIARNVHLDHAILGDAKDLPFADRSFDAIVSDNVLEHLPDPFETFREVARVLKPGGYALFKTPNRRHYVPLMSRVTPHKLHQWFVALRGRDRSDTFPTVYRANTPDVIKRLSESAGLKIERFELIEGRPEYGRVAWPLYLLGALYERAVNRFGFLARFRVLMIVVLRSPKE